MRTTFYEKSTAENAGKPPIPTLGEKLCATHNVKVATFKDFDSAVDQLYVAKVYRAEWIYRAGPFRIVPGNCPFPESARPMECDITSPCRSASPHVAQKTDAGDGGKEPPRGQNGVRSADPAIPNSHLPTIENQIWRTSLPGEKKIPMERAHLRAPALARHRPAQPSRAGSLSRPPPGGSQARSTLVIWMNFLFSSKDGAAYVVKS